MATIDSTSKSTVTIDTLSKDERILCVSALQLKLQSVERAARAESNLSIRDIREAEAASYGNLIRRFSFS